MIQKSTLAACAILCLLLPTSARAACTVQPGESVIYKTAAGLQHCPDGENWTAVSVAAAIPAGAVMAFDLTACPSGWSPYAPSSGRFLRGRCISGEACHDPDGTRTVGAAQADDLKSHTHGITTADIFDPIAAFVINDHSGDHIASSDNVGPGEIKTGRYATNATGGAETRPRNVTVLYCRKD